ncbi:hypothetical protein [Nostoc flagelliforme]|uniref:hypothetical protein n=1 Tax=Nostoc flagelliforme TaxID=1306274 RepID=UPI0018F029B4|nr:hypothetical protein [Nostoc flagelliforme]
MKLQLIFGVLMIATGLLGGSLTYPAIAKRCCVHPWRLPLGEAQIAHRIPPQQTSPILIATAYTERFFQPKSQPQSQSQFCSAYSYCSIFHPWLKSVHK